MRSPFERSFSPFGGATQVAPQLPSVPQITASNSLAARTLTIRVDQLTGSPAPSVALTALTLDGTNVLADATGTGPWSYTVPDSAAARTVAWQVTATNSEGSASSSGSEVVAANLSTPSATGGLADQTLTVGLAMTPVDVSADFDLGTPAATIALQSGVLPAGLSFDGTTLAGTPSAVASTAALVFRADNGVGIADTGFQVTVEAAAVPTPPMARRIATPLTANVVSSGHSLSFGPSGNHGTNMTAQLVGGQGVFQRSTIPGSPMGYRRTNAPPAPQPNAWADMASFDLIVLAEAVPLATSFAGITPAPPDEAVLWYNQMRSLNPSAEMIFYNMWAEYNDQDPARWVAEMGDDLARWDAIRQAVNDARGDGPEMFAIPANRVMMRLYDDFLAGNVPGLTDFNDVFQAIDDTISTIDGRVHLIAEYDYMIALTIYATIYQQTPVGLPLNLGQDSVPSAALGTYLQQMVWDVVQSAPEAGFGGFAPVTNNRAVLNLAGPESPQTAQPFMNVAKLTEIYTNTFDPTTRDANGWPTSGPGEYVMSWSAIPNSVELNGTYRLTWDGGGDVSIPGGATNETIVDANTKTYDITVGSDVFIRVTPPATNVQLVHMENVAAYDAGAIFRPLWITHVRNSGVFRFMDWAHTNGSTQLDWSDRATLDSHTWTENEGGIPWEVMIRLCNETGVHGWFNIPHQATDAYGAQMATLLRDTLNPALTVHVEYSNETWNQAGGFAASPWLQAQALARWGTTSGQARMQFAGLRAALLMDQFDAVFADQPDRIVKIAGIQTDNPGIEQAFFNAPLWVAEGGVTAPLTRFDGMACTLYFDGGFVNVLAGGPALHNEFLTRYANDGEASAFAWVYGQIKSDIDGTRTGQIADCVSRANALGLDLYAYEGGTHVVAGGSTNDALLRTIFGDFHDSGWMADLYRHAITMWEAQTGPNDGGFAQFGGSYPRASARFGYWGLVPNLSNRDIPRYHTVMDEYSVGLPMTDYGSDTSGGGGGTPPATTAAPYVTGGSFGNANGSLSPPGDPGAQGTSTRLMSAIGVILRSDPVFNASDILMKFGPGDLRFGAVGDLRLTIWDTDWDTPISDQQVAVGPFVSGDRIDLMLVRDSIADVVAVWINGVEVARFTNEYTDGFFGLSSVAGQVDGGRALDGVAINGVYAATITALPDAEGMQAAWDALFTATGGMVADAITIPEVSVVQTDMRGDASDWNADGRAVGAFVDV